MRLWLCIQYRTFVESVQYVVPSTFNVSRMFFVRWQARRAPITSSRDMITDFRGETRLFETIRRDVGGLMPFLQTRFVTAAYASLEASDNVCNQEWVGIGKRSGRGIPKHDKSLAHLSKHSTLHKDRQVKLHPTPSQLPRSFVARFWLGW